MVKCRRLASLVKIIMSGIFWIPEPEQILPCGNIVFFYKFIKLIRFQSSSIEELRNGQFLKPKIWYWNSIYKCLCKIDFGWKYIRMIQFFESIDIKPKTDELSILPMFLYYLKFLFIVLPK